MATECTRDAIQSFLAERGGRVPHADLTHHFRRAFPEDDPPLRTALRETFKTHVDAVACVRVEDGVRLVCLKKRYMRLVTPRVAAVVEADPRVAVGNGAGTTRAEPADRRARRDGDGDRETSPSVRANSTTQPGSDYGNDSQVRASAPPVPYVHISSEKTPASPSTADTHGENDMGNRWTSNGGKTLSIERCAPRIAVIDDSPLPVAGEGSVFVLPGSPPGSASQDTLRHSLATAEESQQVTSVDEDVFGLDDGGGQVDSPDFATNRSPQALRSMSQRNASFRSARRGDADSDAASLASSNADTDTDDGSSSVAALDPLEHEWMMCASDGEWERLVAMLTGEPSLVLRKDFVTGFNLLHWAAKRGDPELLALAVNFAKRRGVPVDINTRSSCGYTPLHLAAMHGHLEVVKLLVGAYDADVEVRDYGGQKAAQYLANGAALDIRDIIGAFDDGGEEDAVDGREEGARWSFLPHLRPLRMPGEGETGARARVKPLRRMSSLGRVKPRLQKLRDRTSQIVHSASFRELGVGPARPRSEYVPGPETAH
ncbi:ankyrin repeat domain-containing protein SOWAHC [Gadus morhua]|uniref:ankyrin repeat domain-containing protein SOWAHC n=1 Tax=Gadus morhua TaxID=8049 RepID=UPI0011B6CB3F|nr:ankyrin repeat domain-containing protein SOWAHC-like [Gadus morhua]